MKSQHSAAFYKSLFDNTLDGLAYCQMIFDKQDNPVDWIYVEVNKNFGKLTGLKGATAKKVTELIPGIRTSNPELFEIYGRVSLAGEPKKFETYVEPLERWFLVSVYRPKKKFFLAVFQNITERKLIEKNLENANIAAINVLEDLSIEKSKVEIAKAKDEAMLASIGDAVVATDQDGKVIVINKTVEVILGFTNIDLMGKLFIHEVSQEDAQGNKIPDKLRPITLALHLGKSTTVRTYQFVHKDGSKVPVAITVTPVIIDSKTIGAIIVFRDITKEKEIDKAKTEFVSLASHQLRTPLSAVKWYTEMLLAGDAGRLNEEQKKYLDEVYRGNQRMIALVNALLNVSRIELGTFLIEPEPTDVAVLIQNVINEQQPLIDTKRIQLSLSLEKNIPLMQVDPKLLRMVMQNLLSNAVKYTAEDGKIEITFAMVDTRNVLLKIADTGYGIPKKQQDKIFTKLFRADNIRKTNMEGTGLGLYIAKSIIELSGGKVWFESVENTGTTFYVQFPLEGMKMKDGTKQLL